MLAGCFNGHRKADIWPHLWHLLLLELHDDASEGVAAGGNVEVNLGSGHCELDVCVR